MKLIKKVVLLWALLFTAPVIAAPSDFLVTTDWLEKNLNNPKLRLIEVSVILEYTKEVIFKVRQILNGTLI